MDQRVKLTLYPQELDPTTGLLALRGSVRRRKRAGEPANARESDWVHIFSIGHISDHKEKGIPKALRIFQGPKEAGPKSKSLTEIGEAWILDPGSDQARWFHPLIEHAAGKYSQRVKRSLRIFAGLDIPTANMPFVTRNDIEIRPQGATGAKVDERQNDLNRDQATTIMSDEEYEEERRGLEIKEEAHDDCDAEDNDMKEEGLLPYTLDPVINERIAAGRLALWQEKDGGIEAPRKFITNMRGR